MSRMSSCVFLLVVLIPTAQFSGLQESVGDSSQPPNELDVDLEAELQSSTLQKQFPDTTLVKRFESHGSTRLLLEHHGQPLKIIAHHNGQFTVRQTREFSNDDIDTLTDYHPELVKYASAFPRETKGNTRVKVKIETEMTIQLANEYEFRIEHPEVFELYQGFRDSF